MCFHTESEMNWFLARTPMHSAIIMRSAKGNYVAGWLVDPLNDAEIPVLIASLRAWHPRKSAVIDLTLVNEARLSEGLPVLNAEGLPIYRGFVPARAEDTPIGQGIKDLLAQFAASERELARA
jgi:hypothetical protein